MSSFECEKKNVKVVIFDIFQICLTMFSTFQGQWIKTQYLRDLYLIKQIFHWFADIKFVPWILVC